MATDDVIITGIYGPPSRRVFRYDDDDDVEVTSVIGFPRTTARTRRPTSRQVHDMARDRSRSPPVLSPQSPPPNPASARLRLAQTPRSPSPRGQYSDFRVIRFFDPPSSPLDPLTSQSDRNPVDHVGDINISVARQDNNNDDGDGDEEQNVDNNGNGSEQEDNVNNDVGGDDHDNNMAGDDGEPQEHQDRDQEVDDNAYDIDTELDDNDDGANSDLESGASDEEDVSSNTDPPQIGLGLFLDDTVLEDRINNACDKALVRRPVGPIRRLIPSALHKYIDNTVLNALVILGGSFIGTYVVSDLIAPLNDGLNSIGCDDDDSVCSQDSRFGTTSTTSPLSVLHQGMTEDQYNNPKVYEHILTYLNDAPDLPRFSLSPCQRDTRLAIATVHPHIFNLLIDQSRAFECTVCTNPLD